MFDISFAELFILAVIALVILGPQRLPVVFRMLGLWIGRLRRTYNNVRLEIEREVGMDEVRRQLHNEQIMGEIKDIESKAKNFRDELTSVSIDPSQQNQTSTTKQDDSNEVTDNPDGSVEKDPAVRDG